MKSNRQTEEDALRILQLLNYPLRKDIKDELQAQLVKICDGKDPYRRDLKEEEKCLSSRSQSTLRRILLRVTNRKQR